MTLKRSARLAVWLLLAALCAWAIYLLAVGVSYTSYPQVQPGQPLPPGETARMPYWPALYSPLTLVLVAIGTIKDEWLPLAWVGLLLHLALGGLLIFSLGLVYIAAAGALAVPVGLLAWQAERQVRWLLASGAGAALVVLVGITLRGTIYGVAILAAGVLMALLVVPLARRH